MEKHIKAIHDARNPPEGTTRRTYRLGTGGQYVEEKPDNYPIKTILVDLLQRIILQEQYAAEFLAEAWGTKKHQIHLMCGRLDTISVDLLAKRLAQLGWSFDMRVAQQPNGQQGDFRLEVVPLPGKGELSPENTPLPVP